MANPPNTPQTLWEVSPTSQQSLSLDSKDPCSCCRELQGYLETTVAQLSNSASQGCALCNFVIVCIQAFAANLEDIPEAMRAQLCDFSNSQKVLIQRRPNVHLVIPALACDKDTVSFELELFVLEHNTTFSKLFTIGNHVPDQLTIEHCADFINRHISICQDTHVSCKMTAGKRFLPRRVLDVSGGSVKLVDTALEPRLGDYITLSYCWGNEEALFTTTGPTIEERMEGIEWSALDQTFQDAVTITRRLDIDYIWIDRLCIVQDDSLDWETEASKMAQYYSQSYATLAATIGKDPKHGLFSSRHKYPPEVLKFWRGTSGYTSAPVVVKMEAGNGNGSTDVYVRRPFFDAILDFASQTEYRTPLNSRGWVLQERVLSRRTIHFHKDEMVFECQDQLTWECKRAESNRTDSARQSWDSTSKQKLKTSSFTNRLARLSQDCQTDRTTKSMMEFWTELVRTYSALDLTFERDRLPALSGIARRLSEMFDTTYLAGLWREDLPSQLLWSTLTECIPRLEGLGPTWSWISVLNSNGFVTYICGDIEIDNRVKILEASCVIPGGNEFGFVESGFIKINAVVVDAALWLRDKDHPAVLLFPVPVDEWNVNGCSHDRMDERNKSICRPAADLVDLDYPSGGDFPSGAGSYAVRCILLALNTTINPHSARGRDISLVVRVKDPSAQEKVYERVGISFTSERANYFKDAAVTTITVV
ncbi:hypothetical protein VTL71DRAFT_307 [Oculimacula yallundae]|uniref:Heterokaryon incompatibility domain-containing protein n=1 Tax=Oculimacula yallundae TaxID=86028 RepID=A0ABR4D207_9HELO